MKQRYLETTLLIERLHRQFLEVVKAELDRLGITGLVGKDAFFATGDDVVVAFRQRENK